MKTIEEITCCIVDAGTFVPLADMMARSVAKCYYYSPFEQEYLGIERCVTGDGCEGFERLDEFLDPDVFPSIDLFIFPDIGFGGLQRHLRGLGKLVWGSMGASDLELFRTKFLDVLQESGLPIVGSKKIRGLTALAEHLKGVEDKWVKINRYRDNMETWHHIDYVHSQRELERLALCFGPMKDRVVFVVQDAINSEEGSPVLEVGYDGWTVDGKFPSASYQGYEKKNQLYLGSRLASEELPEAVRYVNQKIAPHLIEYGYRNFWASEIRIKDDVPYFIDPTARMAGQTMEHLLETCSNLADVIYSGAQGELIVPEFTHPFAAEATIHYTADNEGWKTLRLPDGVERWIKLYRYCCIDGVYQFPPHKSDELGVVVGNGDTIEKAVEALKDHFGELEGEPVSIELAGFVELLDQIHDAENEGVEFSDKPIPKPSVELMS